MLLETSNRNYQIGELFWLILGLLFCLLNLFGFISSSAWAFLVLWAICCSTSIAEILLVVVYFKNVAVGKVLSRLWEFGGRRQQSELNIVELN